MQLFKGLVTLGILITGCATGRYADLGWAEMAAQAGDQNEFKTQLQRVQETTPGATGPFLLQMRRGTSQPTAHSPSEHRMAALATASRDELITLSRNPTYQSGPLRRPLMRALLHSEALEAAERLAEGAHEHLLIAVRRGDPVSMQQRLASLANERQPSDAAVRDVRLALQQLEPAGSPASREALRDLAARNSAGKALKTLESAPQDDCLAAIVGGLALEDLGQPAAATQRLESGECVTARAHWARLGMALSPQEARLVLEQVLEAAPLNRAALQTARLLFSPDHPLHVVATQRLAAWVPTDLSALASMVELEQREGRWLAAASWIDRSLRFAWNEELHAQALQLMAKAGAAKRGHPAWDAFHHRLTWLRARRPELAEAIDQVATGEAPARLGATP